jgi:hypothetical protein
MSHLNAPTYLHIHIHIQSETYIYIYIYRERQRESRYKRVLYIHAELVYQP